MPKERRAAATSHRASPMHEVRTQPSTPGQAQAGHRNAAIWSDADDQVLIAARTSGLNWQPIASTHFPTKTANACRKRHERLMERRNRNDWDSRRLDALATEYMVCRREMWTMLAARLGERWALIEAKVRAMTFSEAWSTADCQSNQCMEKGLKNLHSMARAAHKRSVANHHAHQRGSTEDHEGDSGIGFSDGDAEMEVGEAVNRASAAADLQPLQPVRPISGQMDRYGPPPPLPLYEPPPSVLGRGSAINRPQSNVMSGGLLLNLGQQDQTSHGHEHVADQHVQRGVSIRSMLLHPEDVPEG